MKVRILVTLEEIDNGWLDPARKESTCAVAQALVNAKIVRDERARSRRFERHSLAAVAKRWRSIRVYRITRVFGMDS